ncbi:MAG TPA: hypothetical protein VGC37_10350 [Friedmanniella sp.]
MPSLASPVTSPALATCVGLGDSAVRLLDGVLVTAWLADDGRLHARATGTLLVLDSALYSVGDGVVWSLDARTGASRWSTPLGTDDGAGGLVSLLTDAQHLLLALPGDGSAGLARRARPVRRRPRVVHAAAGGPRAAGRGRREAHRRAGRRPARPRLSPHPAWARRGPPPSGPTALAGTDLGDGYCASSRR